MSCNRRNVVITGAGIASAAGFTVEENLSACWEGKCFFREITRYDTAGTAIKYGAQYGKIPAQELPDRKIQKYLNIKDVASLIAITSAAKNAGLDQSKINPERFGIFVGSGSTQIGDLTPYFLLVKACVDEQNALFDSRRFGGEVCNIVNPMVVMQALLNNSLCFGSKLLDARGTNANYMDFEISGMRAVGEAFNSIAENRADAAVAGALSATLEPFNLLESYHLGIYAKTNEDRDPARIAKPFDANRCGAIPAEGAAYIVLEEEERAQIRGANILGRIAAVSFASDSHKLDEDTESSGLLLALKKSLDNSQHKVSDIGLIAASANGSEKNDKIEAKTYVNFLADARHSIPVFSTKGVTGEMNEASSVLSLILTLDALKRKKVPRTFNFEHGDDVSSQLLISGEENICRSNVGIVSSRSQLGVCGTVVLVV